MTKSSKRGARLTVAPTRRVPRVLISASWCAALLALACAHVSEEPSEGGASRELPTEAAAGQASAGASAAPPAPTWCEARSVLQRSCQRCHGQQPTQGAPFALVTYEDLHVLNKRGKARFELVASAVESERMPPTYLDLDPPVEALEAEASALLLAWCEQGAPGNSGDGCATEHDEPASD